MIIRYGNLSEKLRDSLENDIELLHIYNPKRINLAKAIINYFNLMEDSNEQFYRQVMGLLVADTFKLLNVKKMDNYITKEEKSIINELENLDNTTAVSYLRINPERLISSLYNMSEFNSLDYFMKRSILTDSKKQAKYLCNLSEYSVYDFLYYCQKYELETLKVIFYEELNDGYSEENIINRLIETVNDLYVFDRENYKDLIIDLLTKYYLLYKNKLINENQDNSLVSYIEYNEMTDVLNYLNDDKIIYDVLKSYLDFDGDINKLNINNDDKTLEKIKEIREI